MTDDKTSSEQTETPVEETGGPLYRSAHGVAVSVIEAINAKAGRLMDDETLTDLIRDAIELELDVNALNASPEDSVLLRAEKNPAPAQDTGGDVERVAKDAAERAAKNSGAPAELLYAPILFALRDGLAAMRPVSVDRES